MHILVSLKNKIIYGDAKEGLGKWVIKRVK